MCFLLHPVVKSEKQENNPFLSAEDARRLFEKLSADWLIVSCSTASRISVYVASRWWRRTVLGGWSRAGCRSRRSPVRCWVSVELRMVVGRGSSSWRVGSRATPWRWRSRWWSIRRMRIARSGWWYGCWRWRGRTVRTCRNRSSLRGASNLRWWRYPYCARMNALQMNKTRDDIVLATLLMSLLGRW